MRLQGKVALISGAANGMGEAEAKLFAQEAVWVPLWTRRRIRNGVRYKKLQAFPFSSSIEVKSLTHIVTRSVVTL